MLRSCGPTGSEEWSDSASRTSYADRSTSSPLCVHCWARASLCPTSSSPVSPRPSLSATCAQPSARSSIHSQVTPQLAEERHSQLCHREEVSWTSCSTLRHCPPG